MICPWKPPPSASNPKPSSAPNWLDRLRSSRGFPPADQNPPSSATPEPPRFPTLRPLDDSHNGDRRADDATAILCDLFAMGGETSNRGSNGTKRSRKQLNPRFWDATGSSNKSSNGVSSDDLRRRSHNNDKIQNNNNSLNCNHLNGLGASSGDHSLNQHRKERDSKGELGLEEADQQEFDLKGYSKSEVTVIDSSIQGWKVELLVFRKRKGKSVWKVREKTSKSRNLLNPRRKRKLLIPNSDGDDDNDNGAERREKRLKKKMVVRVSDSAPADMLENGNNGKEVAVVPFINEGQVQDDKFDHTLKGGIGCVRGEASVKSSHWKSRSESSSVILVKPLSFDKSVTRKLGKIASINKDQNLD